ncbi:MAG: ABC transporter ATP-binding protein [Pseudomonadales bacterium]
MLELHDIDLGAGPFDHAFPGGAITVVLGRNRSGKTHLCRLVAGLVSPGQGTVRLDGTDISSWSPGRRSVAMVYQSFVNYPNLSVYDNLAAPMRARRRGGGIRARIAGRGDARMDIRVRELADRLGLTPYLARLPSELSGGQQQRLAIGRALAKQARVLVLDEPLVNLDYKLREALEQQLRELLLSTGVTVIYTSSDPRDAFSLGDEVLLLDRRQPVQHGTPLAVYQHPDSLAAADLMSDPGINRFVEDDIHCAVRPEHLSLAADPERPQRRFEVAALDVETNGSETYLHADYLGHPWIARLVGLARVRSGQAVTLYAPADAVLRFPGSADG